MPSESAPATFKPWVHRASFPIVSGLFYLTQFLIALSVYQGWIWLTLLLVILASHPMHGFLIGFHEASHGMLRKSRFLNELDGILVGILSLTSFTLYRALHQKHHVHLATRKDVELWPFVDPGVPLWGRRLAAFLELNFGFFFTPFLFWRAFFQSPSPISNRKVRQRIKWELAAALTFWALAFAVAIRFQLWPWFFFNYFLPAFVAGNLQSWRKYIEHVGLNGNTARSATRSIVANTWTGRLMSLTLLHEPLHGIHHVRSSVPHYDLPQHTDWLNPVEPGDTAPFPNYRSAFKDLIRRLWDPQVGGQWNSAPAAEAA
jgi:fatty acid desaturase